MKVVLEENNKFVLRFDKGEEVISGLKEFMQAQAISACVFNGIGACSLVELWFYKEGMKDYEKKAFEEELEILSISGNGGMKDNSPIIHCHGLFGKNDFSTIGGHVGKLIVSATCELFLTKLNGKINRQMNKDLNLNLMS